MLFKYYAKDSSGTDKTGEIEALDSKEAIEKLHAHEFVVISIEEALKKCPFCAEEIRKEAVACRFCGRNLETGRLEETKAQSKVEDGVKLGIGMFIVLPLIIIGSIIFISMAALSSTRGYGTAVMIVIIIVILLWVRGRRNK